MNRSYDDILGLTERKPSFFQTGGVPRWGAFEPGVSTDIYARDCAIAEIACQSCDMRFHVLMESTSRDKHTVAEDIRGGVLAYRDPPNVGCCASGPSMTSETIRVIEYWERQETFQWRRDPSLEISFRRYSDPWTPEMLERARAIAADPEMDEATRTMMRDGLAAEDERRGAPEEPMPDPIYATEFETAAA
jgi:hypothetical protein